MKRLLLLWMLLASYIGYGQTLPDINARPPRLPAFQVSRQSPFSFSFQIRAGYVIDEPVVAEVFRDNMKLIDSTEIDVQIRQNYVTVSFTQQQISSLPSLSQCYISWGNPRIRRLVTDLKPGTGGGVPTIGKIALDIIEVQIVGDSYNSALSATQSEMAKQAAEAAKDTAARKAIIADSSSAVAVAKAILATQKADSAIIAKNIAMAAKDTALSAKAVVQLLNTQINLIADTAAINKDSSQVAAETAIQNRVLAQTAKAEAEAIYQDILQVGTNAFNLQDAWNPSTSTPNLAALTLTNTAADKGKYWVASVAGTNSITGSSLSYAIGDGVAWTGLKWIKVTKQDLALQKTILLDGQVEDLYLQVDGKTLQNLGIPLSLTRYTSGGTSITPGNTTQTENDDRSVTVGGYTDVNIDTHATFFSTGISNFNGYKKVVFEAKVISAQTTNPAIGIGFVYSGGEVAYVYRKDGSRIELTHASANTILSASTGRAYIPNDVIRVEITNTDGVLKLQTYLNSVAASEYTIGLVPNGGIVIGMRGAMSFTYTLTTYQNSVSDIAEANAKSFATTINAATTTYASVIDQKVDQNAIYQAGSTATTIFGVTSPANITATGTDRTRLDNTPVSTTGNLKTLRVFATTAGPGKVKFVTKNGDGTFNLVKQFSYTFVLGENVITSTTFGANYEVQSGWYVGFYVANPAVISGQDVGIASSFLFTTTADFSGNNVASNGTSVYKLQYNMEIESVVVPSVTVKAQIADNTTKVGSIQSDINVSESYDYTTGAKAPGAATNSGTARTRVDLQYPIPFVLGTQTVTSVTVFCEAAGSGKIKMVSKNSDNTYNVEKEISATFVVGSNTITFPANFTVQPGWYFAFYVNTAAVSAILQPAGTYSMQFNGEMVGSGNTPNSISVYDLQFNATIHVNNASTIGTQFRQLSANVKSVLYVDGTYGSDLNNGSLTAPFKTISRAIYAAVGKTATRIIAAGGDYYETLDFSPLSWESVTLTAYQKGVVRVMGSTRITGWVKTAGYTNIYEATFTGTIPSWSHPVGTLPNIFEDKNASKQILSDEVNSYQKGLGYRLPYTEIPAVASGASLAATLTTMDGLPGRHYLSGGKLYIHASGSTSPLTNGFSYHIPVRAANAVPTNAILSAKGQLSLENIQFYYPNAGFQSSGFGLVTRIHCSIFGVVDEAGGWRDDGAHVISYKDEAAGCSNDGFNQHYDLYNGDFATQDVRRGVGVAFYYAPWSHDNKDDGMSCHQRSEVTVYGALSEYNGDGGYIPANGGTYRIFDAISRKNQQASDASQAGFGTANSAAGTGRNQTTLSCYNCISIGDKIGFKNESESGSIVNLWNPVARESTLFNYQVVTSGGIMNINNGKSTHSNSAKHKSVAAGGVMNIVNDPVLAP